MRNHDPSAAAISFRQVMTPGSEAFQVKRSRGLVCPARWPSWSSLRPARSSSPRRSPWVRQVHTLLTGEIWAHESAEESDLYPGPGPAAQRADPTATMSRAHAQIGYQIARLGRLIADIGDRVPDETDVADLRSALYGLHAILRLHTAQEDEAYLSLHDDAETVGGRP